jgi:hypothetical protein
MVRLFICVIPFLVCCFLSLDFVFGSFGGFVVSATVGTRNVGILAIIEKRGCGCFSILVF